MNRVESILTDALNEAKPSAPHLEAVNLNDPDDDIIDALMDGPEYLYVEDLEEEGFIVDRGIIDMDEGMVSDQWVVVDSEGDVEAMLQAWIDEVVL